MPTPTDVLDNENETRRLRAFEYTDANGLIVLILKKAFSWCPCQLLYMVMTRYVTIHIANMLVNLRLVPLKEKGEWARAKRILRYADDVYALIWLFVLIVLYLAAFRTLRPLPSVEARVIDACKSTIATCHSTIVECDHLPIDASVENTKAACLDTIAKCKATIIESERTLLDKDLIPREPVVLLAVLLMCLPFARLLEMLSVIVMLHANGDYTTDSPARATIKTIWAYFDAVLAFSVIYIAASYLANDRFTYDVTHPGLLDEITTPLYVSVVTMTTLGYGDFSPTTWLTRMIVMAEVFVGIILLVVVIQRVFAQFGGVQNQPPLHTRTAEKQGDGRDNTNPSISSSDDSAFGWRY